MNNFKKLALGLVVGALAIGGSAFKNAEKKSITENFLVQTSTNNFNPLSTTLDPEACTTALTTLNCIYNVTVAGKANIPALAVGQHYTSAQITSWLAISPNPYLTVASTTRKGLYQP